MLNFSIFVDYVIFFRKVGLVRKLKTNHFETILKDGS
jgi:hypothetical protein